jgi:hypothetical protein
MHERRAYDVGDVTISRVSVGGGVEVSRPAGHFRG